MHNGLPGHREMHPFRWASFIEFVSHFECILKSLAGGLNQRISVAFGIANGTLRKLLSFFPPFLYIRFFPTRFYCLKYLQVCVLFVCMIKLQKKNTIKLFRKFVPYRNSHRRSYFLFLFGDVFESGRKCVIVIVDLRFIPLTNCGLKDTRLFYMYVIY